MQQHAAPTTITTAAGLTLQLSPDTAESLRHQHHARRVVDEQESFSSEEEEENRSGSDDWDDVMASRIEHDDDPDDGAQQQQTDNNDDEISEKNDIDDDDVPLSPPPSLPIVVVNLERLVGYVPSSIEEAEQLQQQVTDALCKDDDDNNNNEDDHAEADNLSRHFEERASELFEAGVAFHGDTLAKKWNEPENKAKYAVVSYPEFLCRPDGQGVFVTARQWKRLLRSHHIPVVRRLLGHLAACSRPLTWKVDMNRELWELATAEGEARSRRARDKDLLHWRKTGRKEQLEKLYQVRETFVHRRDLAKIKLSSLEDARDEATATELRRLRIQHGHPGGLEALDFETTMFAFDTSGELLPPSANINDVDNDRKGEHFSSDADSSYDGDDDDGTENSPLETTATDVMQEAFASAAEESARAKARRQAASRKHRRKLASQAEAAKIALEQEKVDQACAEEERIKERLTSPELRKAQAVVASLQDRLASVDELLESLQEEEWADEEVSVNDVGQSDDDADAEEMSFGLLDQVLSMILGTLPTGTDVDLKRHFEYLRWEHAEIVTEWKDYFGRLPPSTPGTVEEEPLDYQMRELAISSHVKADDPMPEKDQGATKPTVSEMRQTMNIIDNDLDNWDDVDDWDALSPSVDAKSPTGSSSASQPTPKADPSPKKGLRPGGRL